MLGLTACCAFLAETVLCIYRQMRSVIDIDLVALRVEKIQDERRIKYIKRERLSYETLLKSRSGTVRLVSPALLVVRAELCIVCVGLV